MNVAVNDASVLHGLSKYNWYQNGSSFIKTSNPGAYIKLRFTGTSFGITVDVSEMNTNGYGGLVFPVIAYSINGGARTVRQLTTTDTTITFVTGLPDSTHSILIDLIGIDQGGSTNRWDGIMALKITQFVIDSSRVLLPATLKTGGYYLAFGDSITEGSVALGAALNPPYYAQVQDATAGYQAVIADYLNMEYGNVAFAGEGWSTGVSSVPGLLSSWNYILNGIPRTFSPTPNIVTINMGTNGSVTALQVNTWLGNLRTALGPNSYINLIIPFGTTGIGQPNKANITQGYNDYRSANPGDTNITLLDLGSSGAAIVTANSYDAIHPNSTGYALLGDALKTLVRIFTNLSLKRVGKRLKFKAYSS